MDPIEKMAMTTVTMSETIDFSGRIPVRTTNTRTITKVKHPQTVTPIAALNLSPVQSITFW